MISKVPAFRDAMMVDGKPIETKKINNYSFK